MKFLEIYLMFWIFAVFGWIMEVIVCSIDDKKIVNRGFLLGPYCPIYGFGGIVMLLIYPYKDDPLICFVLAMVMCSVIEYITSYLMEKLFKVRWWDYANDSFNINGRICLRNAIAFGLLGMLATSYVIPWLLTLLSKLSNQSLIIISIIIFIITLLDIIISCKAMEHIKKSIANNINHLKERDATNDIKEMIQKSLLNTSYLQRRIAKTYHHFSYQRKEFQERLDSLKKSYTRFSWYGTICGIIISLTLSLMTNDYKSWFTIFTPLGFFLDLIIFQFKKRGKNNE